MDLGPRRSRRGPRWLLIGRPGGVIPLGYVRRIQAMSLLRAILRWWVRLRVWNVRRKGLVVADDCRFEGFPSFGSEPYLITIGKHVAMASEVSFITHDGGTHVFRHQERFRKVIKYGRITVHDNCVLGHRVILLPGVSVGPNSVVAAGAVVTRNVPPNTLAAGNPAKPVMSITQYAEWSLAATPAYDEEEYHRDKRSVLTRLPIKGSGRSS
jgi:acetyltransferase-like isoleucine patch superfamily enzyme